ncbi:hypothetical protein CsSME_00052718 [Camellia sinensis var. sinensis]
MQRIEWSKIASNYLIQCQKEREDRVEVGLIGVVGSECWCVWTYNIKESWGCCGSEVKQTRMQRNKRDVKILKDEFLVIKLCILESPWHTFGGFN